MAENNGLLWAEEPEHGLTTAGPKRAEEEEVEHYMDLGFDAEGDDPTGADEEWRYFKNADFDHPTDARAADLDHPIEARLVDLDAVPNDEAAMIGKYSGQLAAATAIDGHNWMYPVAYGIFDKENDSNWIWFMMQLKIAIGTPHGLTIHTDACKGLANAVLRVFQGAAEHRECFRHLMKNFRKKYQGDVLKYMWPCAWACTPRRHQVLWEKIRESSPEAIVYLETNHKQIRSRAKFSADCMVDYVNNNISECFNNWIKDYKSFPVDILMDAIRGKIMEKIATRQKIAARLTGRVLPSVINELNIKSRSLKYTITGSGGLKAEVSGLTRDNTPWRHGVDLDKKTCSCGQWKISGKPCTHVIAFITSRRQVRIEDYVHEYYSVERFKATYQFDINPMVDKAQWPVVDPGFVMVPPKLERPAGRPRYVRKASKNGGIFVSVNSSEMRAATAPGDA
eukprot:XP_008650545.2 uncharacterized protein LOC103631405 [Zea mays]